ncbi:histone acetyltransferase type B catalytic subunit-like [Mizuhopecten yessoensis]|uniref:Histone acetyltransferase type B catalytic subunit n=1 Tax=Mizuhopecten yessoensis TaxID=6573 RepID=A0A210PHA4_MIZYE|nr:histone acetyltransferase type B catalytic subunit-like [Mizuhopecten yessoensis]OWF35869.1 Histone acetyltransferase type B catalytic subunit [Mizuhopecten yessoensis]
MAGISFIKDRLEAYKCSANEVIHFKLVRQPSDIEDDSTTFLPEMSHQLFGEQESIFGYKDLMVEMFYSAARLSTFINMKYSDKVTPQRFDGIQPDNVLGTLNSKLPPGYLTNKDMFTAYLEKDATFKPFGEMMHSYKVIKDNEERHFEIYKTDISAPGFREYHEHLQTFILFFIDAASYIDVDDDRWMFYLLFERYKVNGNPMYAIAGYMTAYNYYAYPAKVRPRISQVLVLPPFQKQGHGCHLVQTFYNDCYTRSEVMDITVEDPSENFQRLRDFVDARNCMKLASYEVSKLKSGFSEEMAKETREKLKLNKRQSRRIYEILRLKATDTSDKEMYRAYRLDIKRRLNAPFQKKGRDFDKLEKVLRPDELSATLSCLSKEQRLAYLENTFQENIDMYRHVIERLNMAV